LSRAAPLFGTGWSVQQTVVFEVIMLEQHSTIRAVSGLCEVEKISPDVFET
jgi:hypothetical protein